MALKYLKESAEELSVRITERGLLHRMLNSIRSILFFILAVGMVLALTIGIIILTLALTRSESSENSLGIYLGMGSSVIFGLPMIYLFFRLAIDSFQTSYSKTHSTLEVGISGISKTKNRQKEEEAEKLLLSQIDRVEIESFKNTTSNLRILPKGNKEPICFNELPEEEAQQLKEKIELVLDAYKLPPTT